MRRAIIAVLASLVAAGCNSSPPPPLTEVDIYWEFERNTLIDGVPGIVPYDTAVNWPPGTGNRGCPQSGVDYVTVTDGAGNLLAGSVPCVNSAVQGAVLAGFPGANTYVVTGWRNGVGVPLYTGSVTVNVTNGVPTYDTVYANGISSPLTIDMLLTVPPNPTPYATCGDAAVDSFRGWVEDGYGTVVWQNTIPCAPGYMPSIQYGPVDRDDLFIWIDTYRSGAIPWSICDYSFPHLQADLFSLLMDVGVCTPPPPGP